MNPDPRDSRARLKLTQSASLSMCLFVAIACVRLPARSRESADSGERCLLCQLGVWAGPRATLPSPKIPGLSPQPPTTHFCPKPLAILSQNEVHICAAATPRDHHRHCRPIGLTKRFSIRKTRACPQLVDEIL